MITNIEMTLNVITLPLTSGSIYDRAKGHVSSTIDRILSINNISSASNNCQLKTIPPGLDNQQVALVSGDSLHMHTNSVCTQRRLESVSLEKSSALACSFKPHWLNSR